MAAGMVYNYAAKQVDENVLAVLKSWPKKRSCQEKYKAPVQWGDDQYRREAPGASPAHTRTAWR